MYICYLDESGTDALGSGTSHFVYMGLAINAMTWKEKDDQISKVLTNYDLVGKEVHAGWLARRYIEQEKIPDFERLDHSSRRAASVSEREGMLIRTAALKNKAQLDNAKKNFRKTADYLHLTVAERQQLLRDLADVIGGWGDARIFAECCDKTSYGSTVPSDPIYETAFTQLISRFQAFLTHRGDHENRELFGMLVHDNNETISRKLTSMMRRFHASGTLWWKITRIIETPLFVDSALTGMIQMSDLCAYAVRRFCENNETDLFDRIHPRFDRTGSRVVGVRHFRHHNRPPCTCQICTEHR